jgi:hypothetical protein
MSNCRNPELNQGEEMLLDNLALQETLTSFLNRWAQHDFIPRFQEKLAQVFQEYLTSTFKQELKVQGTTKKHVAVQASKGMLEDSRARTETHLRLTKWDDRKLRLIDSQDLAELAYDASDTLKAEFREKGAFLSYWRKLHAGTLRLKGRRNHAEH